ncbi:MAG: Mobile element protein, partial [uncultured Rubrobacteraceae bacterium]
GRPDHGRAAQRAERVRGTDGDGSGKAGGTGTAPRPPRAGGRGQGLLRQEDPRVPAKAGHRGGDRPPEEREASRTLRQGSLPRAQRGREDDQPPQAVSEGSDTLREAGRQLPGYAHRRGHRPLATRL